MVLFLLLSKTKDNIIVLTNSIKINLLITIYLIYVFLLGCNSPYSEKLFPMEQFLQGGWYRIGERVFISDTNFTFSDTNTTREILFFKDHDLKQYMRIGDYVELYLWSFLADSTTLYRENDTLKINSRLLINNDTLFIYAHAYPQYNMFLRYNSSSLPSSWPDSIVITKYDNK